MRFSEPLMLPGLRAADREDALGALGRAVIAQGLARPDYVEGLLEREGTFPTGLPLSGGVAIPHTSADYVTGEDTLAVATLAEPVRFGEMGGAEDSGVEVSTVFMLVIADGAQQVPVLSKLIKKLQSGEIVEEVRQAPDAAAMAAVLTRHFPA